MEVRLVDYEDSYLEQKDRIDKETLRIVSIGECMVKIDKAPSL